MEPYRPPSAPDSVKSEIGPPLIDSDGPQGLRQPRPTTLTLVEDAGAEGEVPPKREPVNADAAPPTVPAADAAERAQLAEEILSEPPLVPAREPLGARLAALMGRRHWLLLPLCILLLWAAISLRPPGEGVPYRPGDVVKRDIVAPHGATVQDRALTKSNRDDAAELVPPQYDVRPDAQSQAQNDLRLALDAARREIMDAALAASAAAKVAPTPRNAGAAKRSTAGPASTVSGTPTDPGRVASSRAVERVAQLNATLSRPLPLPLASKILQTKSERWRIVEREASVAVRAAYEFRQQAQKIRSDVEDDMLAARQRMLEALRARQQFGANPSEVEKAFLLASWAVRYPNLVVNERKTENAREAAREAVPAVSRIVVPGTVVVEAGTRLDAARWAELQDLNLVAPRFDLATLIARLVVCGVLVAFAAGYVAHFHPQLVNQPTALWLTAMVPVAFVALFRWGLRIPHGDHAMVPVAATAALSLTILVNARIGIMAGFVVTALCALMARAESGLIIATLLSACIGVLSVSEIASRSHVVRGALILSASNAVLALAMGILREASLDETISLACWGTLAGGFSVLAAVALSQLLEGPFNITTHLRLLELSGPGENVMRRMQAEAPGTYTHSLMVAMLSEAAAKAVGADLLLCRVGGMYHDIGKLRRPHCFVENQSGENVHDRLAPQVSALLISAHVRDGVELGRAIRLPQPVLDIIAQHHGCSLISYFYHRAASEQTVNVDGTMTTPDESLFRYPGPRPQSKESAIVLLADTVEASSRAIPGLTPERLEQHIQTMIAQRLAEGELSECELTMRDLGTIEKTFAHVLRGVLHHRIEYPDPARELNAPEGDGQSWMHEALSDPWDGTDRRDTQREREQARHKVNRPINKNPDQGTSETEKTAAVLSRRGRRRAREQSSSIAKTKSPDIESQTYGNTSKYPQKAEVKTSLRTPKYGARLREANKRDEAGGSSTIREGDQPASAAATGPAATTLGNLERRRRKLAAFASRNGTNGSHDGSHEAPNGNGRTADSNGTEHYREASGESVPANGAVGQHSTGA